MSDLDDLIKMGEDIKDGKRSFKRKPGRPRKSANSGNIGTSDSDGTIHGSNGSSSSERSRGSENRDSGFIVVKPEGTNDFGTNDGTEYQNGHTDDSGSSIYSGSDNGRGNNRDSGSESGGKQYGTQSAGTQKQRTQSVSPLPLDIDIPTEEPKRRGRKPGVKNTVAQSSLTVDVVAGLTQVIFASAVLITSHKHWEINDDEAQAIAEPATKILQRLEKINPKAFEKAEEIMEYATLGINLCAVVGPRMQMEMQYANSKQKSKPIASQSKSGTNEPVIPIEKPVDFGNNGTSPHGTQNWGGFNRY